MRPAAPDPASRAGETRGLPLLLRPGLRVVFIGYNPGLESARRGHYYAHGGNAFWRHLNASGLVPRPVGCEDDRGLLELAGIGFTDLCRRPTLRASELAPGERREGALRLLQELEAAAPAVAAFGGRQLYAWFLQHALGAAPSEVEHRPWGRQPERLAGGATTPWLLPSSSGLSRWHGERLRLLRDLAAEVGEVDAESGNWKAGEG